mmetsp:Transcript_17014/g.54450  ORF Transcript_17014/g.54450 Transcript_17014/m.54450 type:complete len:234 (-) Transcript_17014:1191-1892(-)
MAGVGHSHPDPSLPLQDPRHALLPRHRTHLCYGHLLHLSPDRTRDDDGVHPRRKEHWRPALRDPRLWRHRLPASRHGGLWRLPRDLHGRLLPRDRHLLHPFKDPREDVSSGCARRGSHDDRRRPRLVGHQVRWRRSFLRREHGDEGRSLWLGPPDLQRERRRDACLWRAAAHRARGLGHPLWGRAECRRLALPQVDVPLLGPRLRHHRRRDLLVHRRRRHPVRLLRRQREGEG